MPIFDLVSGKDTPEILIQEGIKLDWTKEEDREGFKKRFLKSSRPQLMVLFEIYKTKQKQNAKAELPYIHTEIRSIFKKLDVKFVEGFLYQLLSSNINPEEIGLNEVLRNLHHRELVYSLIETAVDEKDENRKYAMKVLTMIGGASTFEKLVSELDKRKGKQRRLILEIMFQLDRLEAMNYVHELITQGDENDKIFALNLLARGKSVIATKVATEALKDPNWTVRHAAVVTIGKIGNLDGIAALKKVIEDDNDKVREMAVEVAGMYGGEIANKLLIAFLDDDNIGIKRKAILTLGAVGEAIAVQPLIDHLALDEPSLREDIVNTLKNLSKSGRVDPVYILTSLMGSEHPEIKPFINEFTKLVSGEDIANRLLDALKKIDYWTRDRIARTIIEMGNVSFLEGAIRLLNDKDEIFRRYAVEILADLKDDRVEDLLIKSLEDEDWWVRERAIEALGNIRSTKAVDPLKKVFFKTPVSQRLIADVLGKIGARDLEWAKILAKALKEADRETKFSIFKALQRMRIFDDEVIRSVSHFLDDRDKDIKDQAIKVLERCNYPLGRIEETVKTDAHIKFLDKLLLEVKNRSGSELFLIYDGIPLFRHHGELKDIFNKRISGSVIENLIPLILKKDELEFFKSKNYVETTYEIPHEARFLLNAFKHRGGINILFTMLPDKIPTIDELGLPEVLKSFAKLHQGLVIIAGSGGTGKSTTQAAIINLINETRKVNIITVESPIEFVYENKMSIVNQREVGVHTRTFHGALRATLREDPDVILVGEMRDYETVSMTLTAAETGHLVLGTLNTLDTSTTVERIINFFPGNQQNQVRVVLSELLKGVVCQQLVKKKDGSGRVAALEIMIGTPSISNLIRQGKTFQIPSVMISASSQGMQTMDQSLMNLYRKGIITATEAYLKAVNKKEFEKLLEEDKVRELMTPES